ncbi:MAG: GTPase Era [Acidimicrobiia bacterium]
MTAPDAEAVFGFVALIGRPNVGKSTLVNALVGEKVSIVSHVAQTTRTAVRAVVNGDGVQMVLVDLPGVGKPQTLLGERLNDLATRMMGEVDVVCFVVDAAAGIGIGDAHLAARLPADAAAVCVLNKIDAIGPARIAEQLSAARELRDFDAYVPVSALACDGVEVVADELRSRLPPGEAMFPDDMATDQTESHLIAELVREQYLLRMREELPHSIAVMVDDIEGLYDPDPDEILRVDATVYVERESQKGMVVGKGGAIVKDVGTAARLQAEALLGRRMYLHLRVRVSKDWQRRADRLSRLGY